jgi:hypothetical protein
VQVRDAHDLPDLALLHQQRRQPPRRRPPAVLVHRDPDAGLVGLREHRQQRLHVVAERLLRQHVLAGPDGAPQPRGTVLRAGGQVHHLDVGVGEELVGGLVDTADAREPLPDRGDGLPVTAPDPGDLEAVLGVGGQVRVLRDPARSEDADAQPAVGEAGPVVGDVHERLSQSSATAAVHDWCWLPRGSPVKGW